MIITALPNCKGCIYLDADNLCSHHRKAGVSKLKLGVRTGKTGGCALYKGSKKTRDNVRMAATDYDDRIQELYDKGMGDRAIATALGYSEYQIWHWRSKRALPPKGKPGPKPKKKIES